MHVCYNYHSVDNLAGLDMNCLYCNSPQAPAKSRRNLGTRKYCNNTCQNAFQRQKKQQEFLVGKFKGVLLNFRTLKDGEWTRRLLVEKFGYACAKCGISEWCNSPITLEVNHIDGDASNNVLENVEFLCPNCHSQTSTFKRKNTHSARGYRRKIDKHIKD